mmetsp:Transcript_8407/g.15197  ORF Transcript_8407/g.15197 Transcript_8407/m.15197 type:complete len:209 (+) Transcript_8407:2194-2820(+)
MPLRSVLAPTANIRNDLTSPPFQPARTHSRTVPRQHANLEPAVRVEQHGIRTVHHEILPPNDKVRYLRPIPGLPEALLHEQSIGVEHGGLGFDVLCFRAAVVSRGDFERVGDDVPVSPEPEGVVGGGIAAVGVEGDVFADGDGGVGSAVLLFPGFGGEVVLPKFEIRFDIIEDLENNVVLTFRRRTERSAIRRSEYGNCIRPIIIHQL